MSSCGLAAQVAEPGGKGNRLCAMIGRGFFRILRAGTHTGQKITAQIGQNVFWLRVTGRERSCAASTKGEIVSELLELGWDRLCRHHMVLEAGWRGAVLRALQLNGEEFQLLRGVLGAEHTGAEAGLSKLADRLPPDTAVADRRVPESLPLTWSGSYRRLLNAMMPELEGGLRGWLGRDYGSWINFRNAARADVPQHLVFRSWSRQLTPEARRQTALGLFDLAAVDAVSLARDHYGQVRHRVVEVTPKGRVRYLAGYGLTPTRLQGMLFPTRQASLHFDSAKTQAVETGSLVEECSPGRASMLGSAKGALDPLERRLAASRITVRGNVRARAIVPVQPDAWYDPSVVSRALRAGPSDEVWDKCSATGNWDTFFGRQGLMQRHTAQLVMVAGVHLTVTYHGRFDGEERERIAESLRLRPGVAAKYTASPGRGGGLWPFVLQGEDTAMSATLGFDDAGSLRLTLDMPEDKLQCWGARLALTSLAY